MGQVAVSHKKKKKPRQDCVLVHPKLRKWPLKSQFKTMQLYLCLLLTGFIFRAILENSQSLPIRPLSTLLSSFQLASFKCLCVCVSVCVGAGACGARRGHQIPSSRVAYVGNPIWALGSKLRSSARAARAVHSWAISPASSWWGNAGALNPEFLDFSSLWWSIWGRLLLKRKEVYLSPRFGGGNPNSMAQGLVKDLQQRHGTMVSSVAHLCVAPLSTYKTTWIQL